MHLVSNQKLDFAEFLFEEFGLKSVQASVNETDFCDQKEISVFSDDLKEEIKDTIKTKFESKSREELSNLAEVIESIPEKVKQLDAESLAKKHESEWYHTFRDLKDDISRDLSKKHPTKNGTFQLKTELKDFWENFDEHLDKMILELERIFQRFPTLSRVAILYLLAILISLPLVFFSGANKIQSAYGNKLLDQRDSFANSIELSPEARALYIAKHSSEIVNSGSNVYKVTEGSQTGRVAGAYEKLSQEKGRELSAKIIELYKKAIDTKDEFAYYLKNILIE